MTTDLAFPYHIPRGADLLSNDEKNRKHVELLAAERQKMFCTL